MCEPHPGGLELKKSELIDAVASSAGVDKRQAEGVLDTFFDTVMSEAKGGGKVAWPGFGSFSTSRRSARNGRNPQTGAPVKIAASTGMRFTASSTLKTYLNAKGTKKAAAKKESASTTKAPSAKTTKSAAAKTLASKSAAPAKSAAGKKLATKATGTKKAAKKS